MKKTSDQSESSVSEDRNLVAGDSQQARVLGILARRAGEPVTYDELRAAGIELPASLVSELELAGVEVVRCQTTDTAGRSVRAVRLPPPVTSIAGLQEPAAEPPRSSPPLAPASSKPPSRPRRRPGTRLLAPLALLVAAAITAAVVVAATSAGKTPPPSTTHNPRAAASARAGTGRARAQATVRRSRGHAARRTATGRG